MKNYLILLILGTFALISSSCTPWNRPTEFYEYSEYPEYVEECLPKHTGAVWATGETDIYTYRVYKHSIEFKSSSVFEVSQIKVFDLNKDHKYDTVCVYGDEMWHIGFTQDISKKYRMIKPNLSDQAVCNYLALANRITQLEKANQKHSPKK